MDLGSTADLSDPHGGVSRLARTTGTTFGNLDRARAHTTRETALVSSKLAEHASGDGVSTCVFGSWARGELTGESDYDWAVLVDHPFEAYEPAVAREMLSADEHLGDEERRPGKQGVFGVPIAVPELITNIGLDADTNTNLTRRMLLLLESRELHGQVRADVISRILGRYLNAGVKEWGSRKRQVAHVTQTAFRRRLDPRSALHSHQARRHAGLPGPVV